MMNILFVTGVWDAFDTVLSNINILQTPSGTNMGNTILIVFLALSGAFLVSRKVDDVKVVVLVFFVLAGIMGNPVLRELLLVLVVVAVFMLGVNTVIHSDIVPDTAKSGFSLAKSVWDLPGKVFRSKK